MEFKGVLQYPISDLGVSQLYISRDKLSGVSAWLSPASAAHMAPLPVHDFGDGRYTLTDGHTRACAALMMGMSRIPIVYDRDELVTGELGRALYRMDIQWCARHGVSGVRALSTRALSGADYARLWLRRCERGHNLIAYTTPAQRAALARTQPALFLYGAGPSALEFYFEDAWGGLYVLNPLNGGALSVERD